MPAWLIWLVLAGALAIAEVFTMTFVLVMFAGGAAGAALTAALGGPPVAQIVVALAVSLGLLALVRPVARRHLLSGPASATGSDALVGRQAVVMQQVDRHDGRVRLNGAEWSARSFDDSQVITAGQVVRVMQITGATAVVWQEPE